MNKPKNGFKKENKCPYCDYCCEYGSFPGDEKRKPLPGNLSICLMCCGASQFDKEMNLIKFDVDSIDDPAQRFKTKKMQIIMAEFWEINPELTDIRKKFLINRENKNNQTKED